MNLESVAGVARNEYHCGVALVAGGLFNGDVHGLGFALLPPR